MASAAKGPPASPTHIADTDNIATWLQYPPSDSLFIGLEHGVVDSRGQRLRDFSDLETGSTVPGAHLDVEPPGEEPHLEEMEAIVRADQAPYQCPGNPWGVPLRKVLVCSWLNHGDTSPAALELRQD
jgi:hypothetical protein